jgi:hypothetical protein
MSAAARPAALRCLRLAIKRGTYPQARQRASPVIKIRYGLLPEGLHAEATRQGRHTILRLRPGLSNEQRRDALRRARQHGRMGHGPRLPAAGLAWALGADRVTGTARNTVAAVRCHPLGAGMIAALLTGAIVCYSLFVTVSVRYLYPGAGATPPALAGPVPTASASPSVPAQPGPASASPHSPPGTSAPQPGGSTANLTAPAPGSGAGSAPAPGPSSAPPSPAPTTPAPSPSPTSSAVCLDVGPLGVCLKL